MTGELEPSGDGGELVAPGELRASYADRDRVAEQLRIAAGDGRLTAEELDHRLETALTARTYAELTALTRDLPAAGAAAGWPARPGTGPHRLRVRSCRAHGRWVVPRRIEVRVRSGSARLDFTEAIITQPSVQIDAEVRSGSLTLVTKPGITVDVNDVALRSGRVKDRTQWSPAAPALLHIRGVRPGRQRQHHVRGPARRAGRSGSGCCAVRAPARPTHWPDAALPGWSRSRWTLAVGRETSHTGSHGGGRSQHGRARLPCHR